MEQTYEDLTLNLKCDNENIYMDIKGTVIKVELKLALTRFQMISIVTFVKKALDSHIKVTHQKMKAFK